jgi:predicted DNA-binding protein (MmcQ/YjbR family)
MLSPELLEHLRTICLLYPETTEGEGVGSPSFCVRKKIFAMHHPMNDRPSLWCKAPRGFQETVVSNDPDRYFVPPYVGHHGWVGVWLDGDLDWDFIRDLVDDSYRMTAPKRLVALLSTKPTA